MNIRIFIFGLVAALGAGCDVTTINPVACKLKDPSFCGAGMYCDQNLNACMPGSTITDGGTYSGGDGFIPYCDAANFCMIVPPTQASNLNGIHGTSATDIWAVGDAGTMLHWDGATWKLVPSLSGTNLRGVWGNAANNFYAVGDGGFIQHWDGTAWVQQLSGVQNRLSGVSGFSTYTWAVGDGGVILRKNDGSAWMQLGNQKMDNLYGACPVTYMTYQSIVAVGDNTDLIISRSDVAGTSPVNTGGRTFTLYAASSVGPYSFLGAGQGGQLFGLDQGLYDMPTSGTSAVLFGIWTRGTVQGVTSGVAVGAGGAIVSFDAAAQQWKPQNPSITTTPLYAVWGSSSTDIWIVGAGGIILHWPGMPT